LLAARREIAASSKLVLDPLLVDSRPRIQGTRARSSADEPPAAETFEQLAQPGVKTVVRIQNTDRSFGAGLAGAIAAQQGNRGLPDGSIDIVATGSAGQSFGAFALPGLRLRLSGDANDFVGKSMHGGEIVVTAPRDAPAQKNPVLVGNAVLY